MFEKVNPSHPDKVADRIAGALVDIAYTREENPKIAVEVLLGHGKCNVFIESSQTFADEEIQAIVDRIAGHMQLNALVVKQDSHLAENQDGIIRCGDNGIFKGCYPNREQQLLTEIAGDIYSTYPYDGKYIIHGAGKLFKPWFSVTACQSHLPEKEYEWMRNIANVRYGINEIVINPLGEWTGGPDVDCGATNRKLGSDMGDGVTGGGLHGKDLSKGDVSINIWAFLRSQQVGRPVEVYCSIGDERVFGHPYSKIVATAREYIQSIGGFEKFAEWGLIRPTARPTHP